MSSFQDTTMSRHEMDDLLKNLRRSNAYHTRLAAEARAVARPAHRARKHARELHLSISVEAASRLDHRQISVVPLPLLDLAPSPPAGTGRAAAITGATSATEIVAPLPRYPPQVGDIARPTRPVLRCVIPPRISVPEDVVFSVPERILASRWSASTAGTGETEERDDEDYGMELEIPQPALVGVRYPSNNNDNMDILVSPDDNDFSSLEEARPQHAQNPRPPLPTRIHRHAVQQEKEQTSSPRSAEAPALSHFSSGSESSQSSLELVTPISPEELPEVTCLKRKSVLDDVDTDDEDYYMAVEKRPKYESSAPYANERRSHQRTASSSRRNA